MDDFDILCDELLQEIMLRLPFSSTSSSTTALSLVCKRWLHLYRTSKTSVSLRIVPNNKNSSVLIHELFTFLSLYPSLSSVTLVSDSNQIPCILSGEILLCVASTCLNLRHLRFSAGPVSLSALLSLSSSCKHLTSLTISSVLPISFHWLFSLTSLKELCFTKFNNRDETEGFQFDQNENQGLGYGITDDYEMGASYFSSKSSELPLETLCLSGIGCNDQGLGWLWRNSGKLKKLKLRSCEGLGDGNSFNSFVNCLSTLQEIELRTCRTIVDRILFYISEHCNSLHSLLLYDGASRESLHWFVTQRNSHIQKLDFRLPLDLENNHLLAIAENFKQLASLRLQSCCFVTGEGLKPISSSMSDGLEELALINCDVVDKESGLLTTLGQNLKKLRKLDLSYSEMLVDKEFVSMIVSCKNLVDVNLKGCKKITDFSLVSISKSCKNLESLDIMHCCGIQNEGVELFVLNSSRLKKIHVEEVKLTEVAKKWAAQKFIEIVS